MWRYALVALLPATLQAQATSFFTPYVAVDQSLSTKPLLAGVTLGTAYGPVAFRVGGGVAHRALQLSDSASPVAGTDIQAFAGDVDLVLSAGRAAGASGSFGSLEPRLFAGVGVRGEAITADSMATHRVVSVGTILSYSLFARVRFDVEARRLAPMDAARSLFSQDGGAWEYRAGISLNFGRGNMRPRRGVLSGLPGMPGGSNADRSRVVVTPAAGTLLSTADQQVGTPYVWGAEEPGRGFDCSGFVQWVFGRHGVELPRTSREMALVGQTVGKNLSALRPGDLMFFAERGTGITHVAIYAGNNMMVHSSRSGNGVGYDDLGTPRGRWYQNIFVGAQRVLGVPVQGVQLAGSSGRAGARGSEGAQRRGFAAAGAPSLRGGLAAFAKAAGLRDVSETAKRLYRPDEIPDGPDGAPRRRW